VREAERLLPGMAGRVHVLVGEGEE
jgi:hypothetical protein